MRLLLQVFSRINTSGVVPSEGREKALCWRNCPTVKFCRRRKTSFFFPQFFDALRAERQRNPSSSRPWQETRTIHLTFSSAAVVVDHYLTDVQVSLDFLRKSSLKLVENRWSLKLILSTVTFYFLLTVPKSHALFAGRWTFEQEFPEWKLSLGNCCTNLNILSNDNWKVNQICRVNYQLELTTSRVLHPETQIWANCSEIKWTMKEKVRLSVTPIAQYPETCAIAKYLEYDIR